MQTIQKQIPAILEEKLNVTEILGSLGYRYFYNPNFYMRYM